MSDLFDDTDDAATPLSPSEKRDLKQTHIAFRSELNLAEQINIAEARAWAFARKRSNLLTETFIRSLHRHMLGDVWRWAGRFRVSPRNIGIDHWEIPASVRVLCDDAQIWIGQASLPPDDIAVRFHHRLVQIHPFPNGNGRHARLMADLLIHRFGRPPLSWGAMTEASDVRKRYIDALRAADRHDFTALMAFARS